MEPEVLSTKTLYVIQERLASPLISKWRDSGEHRQPTTLQWCESDAKKRINRLMQESPIVMEYRLARREIVDYAHETQD